MVPPLPEIGHHNVITHSSLLSPWCHIAVQNLDGAARWSVVTTATASEDLHKSPLGPRLRSTSAAIVNRLKDPK